MDIENSSAKHSRWNFKKTKTSQSRYMHINTHTQTYTCACTPVRIRVHTDTHTYNHYSRLTWACLHQCWFHRDSSSLLCHKDEPSRLRCQAAAWNQQGGDGRNVSEKHSDAVQQLPTPHIFFCIHTFQLYVIPLGTSYLSVDIMLSRTTLKSQESELKLCFPQILRKRSGKHEGREQATFWSVAQHMQNARGVSVSRGARKE